MIAHAKQAALKKFRNFMQKTIRICAKINALKFTTPMQMMKLIDVFRFVLFSLIYFPKKLRPEGVWIPAHNHLPSLLISQLVLVRINAQRSRLSMVKMTQIDVLLNAQMILGPTIKPDFAKISALTSQIPMETILPGLVS